MPDTSNKHLYLLLGIGILIFFFNLDVLYVNIMEARNFVTAREMVNSDNWILTTMNGQPRYEKPPLPTWLTAASAMIFGFDSLFGLRLPAALVTMLLLYFFYRLLPQLDLDQKQSFRASLILASSFYIVFMGRNGQWDIFTHGFMIGSIFYLWHLLSYRQHLWRNSLLAALFLGCSIMSKGPVSLYALLLPFLIAYGSVYRFRDLGKKWKPILGFVVVGLLIGGWWFAYVRIVDPVAFMEITSREVFRWTSYNVRPFYYYWSFFIQSGIWTIPSFVALLYPYMKNRVVHKKAYRFSLWWTLAAVILLSLIPEKKSRYLLPVLIPMALNTSFYIEYLFKKFRKLPQKEKWIPWFNHGLIALIGLAFPVAGFFFLELEGYWLWFILTSVSLAGTGGAMIYFMIKQKYPRVFYLTIMFICVITVFGFPLTHAMLENPRFQNFSSLRRRAEREGFKVYEYEAESPEIIWDYGKPIPQIREKNLQMPPEKRFGLLLLERDSSFVEQLKPEFKIISSERYDLNPVHPDKSGYKDRLIRMFYLLER